MIALERVVGHVPHIEDIVYITVSLKGVSFTYLTPNSS